MPKGGFFLWIKIPGVSNSWKITQRGIKEGIIMAPGAAFMTDSSKPCNAVRASFSKASYEEMNLVHLKLVYLLFVLLIKLFKINYAPCISFNVTQFEKMLALFFKFYSSIVANYSYIISEWIF